MTPHQILKLAIKFEKLALTMSAQPSDVQTALEKAQLWNIAPTVSPLLGTAGVPDDATVSIAIGVGPGGLVNYQATLNPNNPKVSGNLNKLLQQKLANPMTQAIKGAGLNVDSPLTLNWLTF